MNYCPRCGSELIWKFDGGRDRPACPKDGCGFVHFGHHSIGCGGVVIRENKALLIQRGINPNRGAWQIPGGYVESDEEIVPAVEREVLEEAGVVAKVSDVIGVRHTVGAPTANVYLVFRLDLISGEPRFDGVETIGVGYFCGLVTWYMVQVHQTKYILELGIGTKEAAYALGFVGLTGSFGLIGLGYLSDRFGRELAWTAAALGFSGCYIVLLVMGVYPSLWLMYLMVILQGLLGYGLASTFAVIPSEIFRGRSVAKILRPISTNAASGSADKPAGNASRNLSNASCTRVPSSAAPGSASSPSRAWSLRMRSA